MLGTFLSFPTTSIAVGELALAEVKIYSSTSAAAGVAGLRGWSGNQEGVHACMGIGTGGGGAATAPDLSTLKM